MLNEKIPCVIYGAHKEPVHFTTSIKEVRDIIYTPEFKIAEIHVDGTAHKCILKEVQFHPVKDTVRHIDFLLLKEDHPIKVTVPVLFEGTSPGVRNGGKFIQKVRAVSIKTKPENMVDHVLADISTLKMGQSLRVRDIQQVKGVEILNPGALPIATVAIPRSLKGATGEEEEPTATADTAEGATEAAE